MGKRKRIGIIFSFDENWTGGVYYLYNIISSLNKLQDDRKPEIVIFYKHESVIEGIRKLSYPFMEFLPLRIPLSLLDRIVIRLRRLIEPKYFPQYPADTVDFIFPCNSSAYVHSGRIQKIRKVYWIADFQHLHLPHFFKQEELDLRDKVYAEIAQLDAGLVLSSEDAKNDFIKHYPSHRCHVKVVHFATVLPEFEHVDVSGLKGKYDIDRPYFMSPNQFWAHKNHLVILRAVALLKKKGLHYYVFFTGKEHDFRNPEYTDKLKKFVIDEGIESHVRFLGFIDRLEQLQLMKHAEAVIQPSLFEGWSTVVEDSKAIGQTLILSDLKVHHEQCGNDAIYFDPANPNDLAHRMEEALSAKVVFPSVAYENKIKDYAEAILRL